MSEREEGDFYTFKRALLTFFIILPCNIRLSCCAFSLLRSPEPPVQYNVSGLRFSQNKKGAELLRFEVWTNGAASSSSG